MPCLFQLSFDSSPVIDGRTSPTKTSLSKPFVGVFKFSFFPIIYHSDVVDAKDVVDDDLVTGVVPVTVVISVIIATAHCGVGFTYSISCPVKISTN